MQNNLRCPSYLLLNDACSGMEDNAKANKTGKSLRWSQAVIDRAFSMQRFQTSIGFSTDTSEHRVPWCLSVTHLWHAQVAASLQVWAGCVITAGILLSGFRQFQKGNKMASQVFMRARVVAQGVTLGLMMTSIYIRDKQKRLGIEL